MPSQHFKRSSCDAIFHVVCSGKQLLFAEASLIGFQTEMWNQFGLRVTEFESQLVVLLDKIAKSGDKSGTSECLESTWQLQVHEAMILFPYFP